MGNVENFVGKVEGFVGKVEPRAEGLRTGLRASRASGTLCQRLSDSEGCSASGCRFGSGGSVPYACLADPQATLQERPGSCLPRPCPQVPQAQSRHVGQQKI